MRLLSLVMPLLLLAAGIAPAAAAEFQPARLSVTAAGKGPDVLLIPGLATPRQVWDDTARRFSADHRLHLVQLAGFGGAPAGPNAEGPVLAPVVEELHQYLQSRHLAHVAVIGHSMGGLMGLMLAKAHPEDVGRLMVVDVLPFYPVIISPEATPASMAPIASQTRTMLAGMTPQEFAAAQQQAVQRMSITPEGQKRVLDWSLASDRRVVAGASADDLTTDLRGELATMTTPITVIYAYASAMGRPAEQVDALYASNYASAPHKRLVRIDGSLHFIMLDQPDAFAKEVKAFLQ